MEPKNDDNKSETMWSSLPMLLLWMIMNKLNIFDRVRFTAVCREWRFASQCNPRQLATVGDDGVPWIWRVIDISLSSTPREFMNFPGLRRFVIDRPEFADGRLLSSRKGWLLLDGNDSLLVLVNVFTGARIHLPHRPSAKNHCGSFTVTNAGVPDRVFIFSHRTPSTVTLRTTLAGGDQGWTCCTYAAPDRRLIGISTFISIGMMSYIQDMTRRVLVFNAADLSFKVLEPPGSPCGFIAEHDGELIYVDRGIEDGEYIKFDYSEFAVYRLNEAVPDSWERLDETGFVGTNWFLHSGSGCISAKGEGLKIYDILQKSRWSLDWSPTVFVIVYDLLAGTAEPHPLPVDSFHYLKWVDIG